MEETLEIRMAYGLWRTFTLRNAEQTNYYESSATCQEDESISLYNFFNAFLSSICKTPTEVRWSYESYVVGSNSACRIARHKLDINADGSEQIQPLGSEFRSCQLSTKQTQLSLL